MCWALPTVSQHFFFAACQNRCLSKSKGRMHQKYDSACEVAISVAQGFRSSCLGMFAKSGKGQQRGCQLKQRTMRISLKRCAQQTGNVAKKRKRGVVSHASCGGVLKLGAAGPRASDCRIWVYRAWQRSRSHLSPVTRPGQKKRSLISTPQRTRENPGQLRRLLLLWYSFAAPQLPTTRARTTQQLLELQRLQRSRKPEGVVKMHRQALLEWLALLDRASERHQCSQCAAASTLACCVG